MPGAIQVDGLAELNRTFRRLDRTIHKDIRDELRVAAEPVRGDAETLARAHITHMTLPWSRMRTGVTTHLVYVAPKKRGTTIRSRKRRNFATLLRQRAMEPALERNRRKVVARVEFLLDRIHKHAGF